MITYINKRCLVMVGTGTNCTQSTIERSIIAQKAGADAVLLVNPYYNKPTQKGMLEHFTAVADSVEIPIMLYNIQGRSGVNLEVPTVLKLSEHPRIVGVKEASGKVGQVEALAKVLPPDFVILSGDDGLTYAISKAGGVGCISVLSNALPDAMKSLVEACNNQRWTEAKALDDTLQPLFTAGGLEVNPQPIKTILAYENLCEETFRLPLTTMESGNREQLIAAWEAYKSKN